MAAGQAVGQGEGMQTQITARALEVGDYLHVAAMRMAPEGHRQGEGYALIERVEHVDAPRFLDGTAASARACMAEQQLTVVFCQGMPGPVLLTAGGHRIDSHPNPARRQWDEANPTWLGIPSPLFAEGRIPHERHPRRGDDLEQPHPNEQPQIDAPEKEQRRATAFSKPASLLMPGDYLQIHARRHPVDDMAPDEGFHRVEWIAHLPAESLGRLLILPEWAHGRAILASVFGLPGTLVLPDTSQQVLVAPNPERMRNDEEGPWNIQPAHLLTGAREPDAATLEAADQILRPAAPDDELDLYPSLFEDPAERDLFLRGTLGVRPVAAADLPWPHALVLCAHSARWKQLAAAYPKGERAIHVAHAELFARLRDRDFAVCPYHQADWQAIAQTALEFTAAQATGDEAMAERLSTMQHLDEEDRQWARDLLYDHIAWSEGNTALTNGQHRLCAMRAAGVTHVPVYGRYLPEKSTGAGCDAKQHARATVEQYWADRLPPRWRSTRIASWIARHPFLRLVLARTASRA